MPGGEEFSLVKGEEDRRIPVNQVDEGFLRQVLEEIGKRFFSFATLRFRKPLFNGSGAGGLCPAPGIPILKCRC